MQFLKENFNFLDLRTLIYILLKEGQKFLKTYPNIAVQIFSLYLETSVFGIEKSWIEQVPEIFKDFRGKQILFQAVKSSNRATVESLIKLVNINEPYGIPLKYKIHKNRKLQVHELHPVTHALIKKDFAMAKLLFSKSDEQTKTASIQTLFNDKANIQHHLDVLSWLVDQGVTPFVKDDNGQTLAQWAIENAYTIGCWNLLESLKKAPSLSSEIKESIEAKLNSVKSNPNTETDTKAEDLLKNLIDEKTVGHLLGDQYLKETGFEGNVQSVSMNFIQNLCAYLIERHGNKFTKESIQELQSIQKLFKESISIAQTLEMTTTPDVLLRNLSRKVQTDLEALSIGQSTILPWGWNDTSGGHAMLLECRKTALDKIVFTVYNTGEGIQFHEMKNDPFKEYANTVRVYEVPLDVIKKTGFVQSLFEPKTLGGTSDVEKVRYGALNLYAMLQPYQRSSENIQEKGFWMRPQFSGTCSMRSLLAYLGHKLGPEEYHKFKLLGGSEVLKLAVANPSLKEQPKFSALIKKIEPNFIRKFGKFIRKEFKKGPIAEKELEAKMKEINDLKAIHADLMAVASYKSQSFNSAPIISDFFSQKRILPQQWPMRSEKNVHWKTKMKKLNIYRLPFFHIKKSKPFRI